MNIEEIVNEHTREIIKNIFSKLNDEEIYVLLELNNQLQDKISKIDKAIEYIKEHQEKQFAFNYEYGLNDKEIDELLEILGDNKE